MKKVTLVTGAARGIGRAISEALAEIGFDCVIADILPQEDAANAVDACTGKGSKTAFIQMDVSDAESRKKCLDTVKAAYGRLDVLVNNAGVAPLERLDILEASEASFDRLININLKGPYFLTQRAARWMIRQKDRDDTMTPIIINLASVSSYAPSIDRGDYCISKAGVSMMTKLYAQRLAAHGIRVYEIRPGVIKTDMTAPVREKYQERIEAGLTPIRRWGYPEDIAKAVVAIAQGLLPFSTGEVINVDGGFHLRIL